MGTETEANEQAAANQYDAFMKTSTASSEEKHKDEFDSKMEKDRVEFEMGRVEKDLNSVNEQLAKANAVYEQLKANCIVVHVSFEEREEARMKEVEALKQALEVLDNHPTE